MVAERHATTTVDVNLLPDVPLIIVLLHFVALAIMLGRVAIVQLQRVVLTRQRRSLRGPLWLRLIHVLLGLPK